jgi:hypothetical protein
MPDRLYPRLALYKKEPDSVLADDEQFVGVLDELSVCHPGSRHLSTAPPFPIKIVPGNTRIRHGSNFKAAYALHVGLVQDGTIMES